MLTQFNNNARPVLAMLYDLAAASLAWVCAYLLRFNFELPAGLAREVWLTLVWMLPLQGIVFWRFGLYRGIWRYASLSDLRRIFWAVAFAAGIIPLLFWMLRLNVILPRSVLIIYPISLMLLMGGGRLVYRLWKEQALFADIKLQGEAVLVLGAGDAGFNLAKDLARNPLWRVVGFLDDDERKIGNVMNGIRVLGRLDELAPVARRLRVEKAIIAMPSASHKQRKRAIDLCNIAGIKALTVPAFDDLMSGQVRLSQLREIDLDDLLGRDPVQLDDAGLHEQLSGKVVLVTGAGGSIGSELCRQIVRFTPRQMVLFDSSEFALYNIEQELGGRFPHLDIVYLAGDVRDDGRLEQVFGEYRPGVVFHAAAYKHVPLMEHNNAWQAVRNNVFGTWRVASCAQRHGAQRFVLISTDKAVNPTNVMGATKRLAEIVCQGLQSSSAQEHSAGRDSFRLGGDAVGMNSDLRSRSGEGGTKFVIVRFGNVLGSNGSVIPKFREQIAMGGPVTVTHPEITRYFMSIPEAAQLVMQAGCMGQGGEIFVLDMGEPVKIVNLAKDLIRLSGLSEDDIRIEFTGLRPGEKLYEELLADEESTLPTPHSKLRIAKARPVDIPELQVLQAWISKEGTLPDDEVRTAMRRWVPEYVSNPNGH